MCKQRAACTQPPGRPRCSINQAKQVFPVSLVVRSYSPVRPSLRASVFPSSFAPVLEKRQIFKRLKYDDKQ